MIFYISLKLIRVHVFNNGSICIHGESIHNIIQIEYNTFKMLDVAHRRHAALVKLPHLACAPPSGRVMQRVHANVVAYSNK
jgi:hypothetical protein